MSVLVFIDSKIPDYQVFADGLKVHIGDFSNQISDPTVIRVGFVWENTSNRIPFGSTPYTFDNLFDIKNNKVISKYFTLELINYLKLYKINIPVDLITCSLKSDQLVKELVELKNIIPKIKFNYSLNLTGNNPRGDWIMESSGENIYPVYFNNLIDKYKHTLLNDGDILPVVNGIYVDYDNRLTFSKVTWTVWDDISQYGTQIIILNDSVFLDDVLSDLINLGFTVNFAGIDFTSCKINSNGCFFFGDQGDNAYGNDPFNLGAYPAIQFFGKDTMLYPHGMSYVLTNDFIVFDCHYTDFPDQNLEYKILLYVYKTGSVRIKYQILAGGATDIYIGLCYSNTKVFNYINGDFYYNRIESILDSTLNNVEFSMFNSNVFNFVLGTKIIGDIPFTITQPQLLIGTQGSRIFTYTSSDPTIASIVGNQITIHAGGNVVITATIPDDTDPLANPGGTISAILTINKLASTLTTFTISDQNYSNIAFTPTLPTILVGDGTISYTSSDPSIATVNSSTGEITMVTAGDVTITATLLETGQYASTSQTATFTILPVQIPEPPPQPNPVHSGGDPIIQPLFGSKFALAPHIKFVNLLADYTNKIFINAQVDMLTLADWPDQIYWDSGFTPINKVSHIYSNTYYRKFYIQYYEESIEIDADTLAIINQTNLTKIKIAKFKPIIGLKSISFDKTYPLLNSTIGLKVGFENYLLTLTADINTDDRHHLELLDVSNSTLSKCSGALISKDRIIRISSLDGGELCHFELGQFESDSFV